MTCEMPLTSMPRAATSVATSVSTSNALELRERALALALGLVAVHRDRGDAGVGELLDELVGAMLGAHEHERQVALGTQVLEQRVDARFVRDLDEAVFDVIVGAALGRPVLVEGGVGRIAAGGLAGLAVERCGEEERLPVGGHSATMRSSAGRKPMSSMRSASSITKRADVVEVEGAAVDLVLEAARRGDDDVRLRGRLRLLEQADAAVDGGDAQRTRLGDRTQLVDDLGGELARGSKHQSGGAARLGRGAVDDRDTERERLAGSGGGASEDVTTGEHVTDDVALDCERLDSLARCESVNDRFGHAEIGEGLLGHVFSWTVPRGTAKRFGRLLADPESR